MKRILFCIFLGVITWDAKAQDELNPINTGAANFLSIITDARTAGMGGASVALTENDNAVFYNASTALQSDNRSGGVTYTFIPWMREYESCYSLNSIGGFYKIDKRNAVLAGVRYYNYPKIPVVEDGEKNGKEIHPKELAVDVGYAREIFPDLSLSATFRYIYSDMGTIGGAKSSSAVAFDLGASYKRSISGMQGAYWTTGAQVSNLGTKIKYTETKEDLPAMAKIGGSIHLPFSTAHRLTIATDLGYRLAPSDTQSFNLSAGAEYTCIEHFMLRGGYHYGDKNKGDTSYATAGLGANCHGVHLDFSWLFAESDSPLRNTFWASLGFSF